MNLLSPATYVWDLYGSSIAFPIRSLDHSLSTRLIAPHKYAFQTGSQSSNTSTVVLPSANLIAVIVADSLSLFVRMSVA